MMIAEDKLPTRLVCDFRRVLAIGLGTGTAKTRGIQSKVLRAELKSSSCIDLIDIRVSTSILKSDKYLLKTIRKFGDF
jgi:hypothetical protein